VRNEVQTAGYTVFNLRGSYAWKHVRLDASVENVLDRLYSNPLGGAYVGQGPSMSTTGIAWGVAVPGPGRSLNVALTLKL
jgi:iron complex outermembrane receptor protein